MRQSQARCTGGEFAKRPMNANSAMRPGQLETSSYNEVYGGVQSHREAPRKAGGMAPNPSIA